MKKKILLFTAVAGFSYLIFSSYAAGPATAGWSCTGAESDNSNPVGCSAAGNSCHGAAGAPTTNIAVTISLDYMGAPVTQYIGGHTYVVKIAGINNGTTNQPYYGFQLTAIKGSTGSLASPVNAGTWASTGLPASTAYKPALAGSYLCNLVEHSTPIPATTGTGGNGSTYVDSFTWTAPAIGTGTISFFGALNAVNHNGVQDAGDLWNTAQLTVTELNTTSVANIETTAGFKAFPNPFSGNLNLQIDNAPTGTYSIKAFDLTGKCVANELIEINGTSQLNSVNTSNWIPGIYQVIAENAGTRFSTTVVKQ